MVTKTTIRIKIIIAVALLMVNASSAQAAKPAAQAAPAATDKRSQAINLYNARDYKGAALLLDDYLTVNSRDPYAAYYAALANQQLGNSNKARLMYRQVYTLAPASQIGGYAKNILLKLDPSFAATVAAAATPSAGKDAALSAKTPEDIARAITGGPGSSEAEVPPLDPTMPAECRIPFVDSNQGIKLDCFINSRPIKMTFDTGAPGVVLGKNHLTELGISLPTGAPLYKTTGSASSTQVDVWKIQARVKVGNIEKMMPVEVLEYDHADPLLGQTFFSNYIYTIDHKGGQLNLKQKAIAQRETVGGAAVSVPFRFVPRGRRIMVDVEVNGKSMPMIFDTGNTANACSFMSEGQLKQVDLTVPPDAKVETHRGVNGSGTCRVFPVRRLKLGPIDQSDVMVSVNSEMTDTEEGLEAPLLGQPFWRDWQYTIDMQKKLIYFIRR